MAEIDYQFATIPVAQILDASFDGRSALRAVAIIAIVDGGAAKIAGAEFDDIDRIAVCRLEEPIALKTCSNQPITPQIGRCRFVPQGNAAPAERRQVTETLVSATS